MMSGFHFSRAFSSILDRRLGLLLGGKSPPSRSQALRLFERLTKRRFRVLAFEAFISMYRSLMSCFWRRWIYKGRTPAKSPMAK